jgi:hypothetical protein
MKGDFDFNGELEMPASPRSMLDPTFVDTRVWDEAECKWKENWKMLPKEKPLDQQVDSALEKQIGGSHYKATKIQPIEVIWDWDLGFELGSTLKYIQRHKNKGGVEDIKKAIHYLELYLDRYLNN